MEAMVGLDAKFLYSETAVDPHAHLEGGGVRHVERSPAGIPTTRSLELFGHRLNRLPPFRRRAVPVPWGLGHPVWVEDPDFDLQAAHHPPPGRRTGG